MKSYLSISILILGLSYSHAENKEILAAREKKLRSDYYKVGAIAGISSFAGCILANGLTLYMLQNREGR